MKAQAKKTKTPVKATAKPAPKAAARSPAKSATKTAAKTVSKAARPVAKAKPLPKPAAKKSAAPKAVKAGKPAAKPVARKAPATPARKPVAKPPAVKAKPAAKPAAKAAPKPVPKPVPKTLPKPVLKTSSQPAKPVAAKVQAPAPAPTPVAPVRTLSGLMAPPPLKPGRRSSARTATQSPPPAPMVPTHAPDAAKASYSIMTERVIAPPPQAAAKKDPKLANNWKTKSADQLTDEEVKAMPDAEYMNEKQLAFFRHKLSVLKQDIHNSAGETTEHLREDTVVVPDPADRATIEEEHALELRTRDRERKLLKKIEQSIARIDSGDYGYCDETGEPIGVGRLIARPTANLSLEAQQRRELKQKMFGD